ncbi:micrococcal nuclease [Duganella sp. CF458]|uniref:thermonuclease family protein n=1 Tax=Duganella sp. CF458 TaxID=1884368 RepID=UPI0008EB07D7|nr:thermonuclease family protein [Duganella sp. CF458]SFF85631.1 micrococcal nuclease [Duganella sp. CF458]
MADGDTLTVLSKGRPVKVRLANIDAPEKKQPYGARSKQSLSDLCFGRDATLASGKQDRYGRTVAVVHCGDVNANVAQVRKGMAWVYPQYNHDPSLPAVEAAARHSRVGLWSERDPLEPWLFRKERKARSSYPN